MSLDDHMIQPHENGCGRGTMTGKERIRQERKSAFFDLAFVPLNANSLRAQPVSWICGGLGPVATGRAGTIRARGRTPRRGLGPRKA